MADEAGRLVTVLEARTDQYDRALQRSGRVTQDFGSDVERSARRAGAAIDRNLGQAGNAARNLGFQLSDIGTQVAGGSSPFLIIAQQGPQVLQAFQDIRASGSALGAVLRTIAVPGFLALASIAVTVAERLYASATASDTHEKATDELADAVNRLHAANILLNHDSEIGVQNDIRLAQGQRDLTKATLEQYRARLLLAKVRAQEGQSNTQLVLGGPNTAQARQVALSDVGYIDKQIADTEKSIADQSSAIRSKLGALDLRRITSETDAASRATRAFENRIDDLQRQLARGDIGRTQYNELAAAAVRARDAAKDQAKAHDPRPAREHAAAVDADTKALQNYIRAGQDLAVTLAEINRKNPAILRDIKLDFPDEPVVNVGDDLKKKQDERLAASEEARRTMRQRQEDDIRTLGGLYFDLFNNGTKGIWRNFKDQALSALATIAAQKTFAALANFGSQNSGAGGLLGSLATLAKNFSGPRAAGGPVAPGNSYLVGENGPELLQMGSSAGNITSHANLAASARAMRPAYNQPAVVEHRIVVEPSPLFATAVQSEVVAGVVQYAPSIIQGAKASTFAEASRPGLPRSGG